MSRRSPHRKFSIDEELCLRLEAVKAGMRRHEALTPFIEWILDMFCEDQQSPKAKAADRRTQDNAK